EVRDPDRPIRRLQQAEARARATDGDALDLAFGADVAEDRRAENREPGAAVRRGQHLGALGAADSDRILGEAAVFKPRDGRTPRLAHPDGCVRRGGGRAWLAALA